MENIYSNGVCYQPIKDYEGLYWINECGEIYTKRKRFLIPNKDKYGYLKIGVCKNGNRGWFTIHRLVALNFIPNENNKPCVNHIDGNKLNNCVDNLEWCTVSENNKHSWKIGTSKVSQNAIDALKKRLCKKVLQLDLSGNLIKEWSGMREAERGVNGNATRIGDVCNGRRKIHKGCLWKYA